MNDIRWSIATLALIVTLATVGKAPAQDQEQPAQPDPAALEKAWTEFATPGKPHEQFKRLVGRWDTQIKAFEPGAEEPSVSKGTANFRMLLGGRYLQQNFRGEMEGQSFRGIGVSGYDNAQQKYVGTWIDSMGTGIMHTTGSYDAKTNTLTETGESSSPMGPMKFRMTSKYISNDEFHFTMHMLLPGDAEMKMMEITYTRAKEAEDE